MTIDASALIELVSLAVTIMGAAFGTGVAVGKLLGKVERLNRKLEDEEHEAHKNDRR